MSCDRSVQRSPCMSDLPIGLSRAAPGSLCSPRLRRYWAALGYQYLRSASSFMNASNCTSMAKPPAYLCYRLDSALADVHVEGQDVTATFADGYLARGNLLVGADGIGSTTR